MGVEDIAATGGIAGLIVLVVLPILEIIKRLIDRMPGMRGQVSRKTPSPDMSGLESQLREQTQLLHDIRDTLQQQRADHTIQIKLLEMLQDG